jgi:hypothetical protein
MQPRVEVYKIKIIPVVPLLCAIMIAMGGVYGGETVGKV